jgi:hypothetical protein
MANDFPPIDLSDPASALAFSYAFENALAAVMAEAAEMIRLNGRPEDADRAMAVCRSLRVMMLEARTTLGYLSDPNEDDGGAAAGF